MATSKQIFNYRHEKLRITPRNMTRFFIIIKYRVVDFRRYFARFISNKSDIIGDENRKLASLSLLRYLQIFLINYILIRYITYLVLRFFYRIKYNFYRIISQLD